VIKDQPGAFLAKTKRGKKRQRTAYQKAQEIRDYSLISTRNEVTASRFGLES
jgi:hypothetical protein